MRILLVSKWQCGLFPQAFSYHGDWVIAFEVALALRTHEVQVGIVVPKPVAQHWPRFQNEFGRVLAAADIQMFFSSAHPPTGNTARLAKWHLTLTTLRAIRRFQPDVIQFWEASPLFPRWLIRKTRIVSVVQARFGADSPYASRKRDREAISRWGAMRLSPGDHVAAFAVRVLNKLWKLDQVSQYPRHCDCLVTYKAGTYRRLLGRWPGLIHYIPKGIGLSGAQAHKPAKGYPSSILGVLFVGVVHYGKGVFDLIEAFQQVAEALPNARLIIVGNGPPDMVAKARELIRARGLTHAVSMVGAVAYHEKWRYHWDCDVFCLPSYGDVYPGAMNEAFSCGKPVVTTQQVDDWVTDGVSGLRIPAGDVDALAQALLKLLRDEQLRHRMGAMTKRAAEGYPLEDMARAFVDLYDRLMTEG